MKKIKAFFANLLFLFRLTFKIDKKIMVFAILMTLFKTTSLYLGIYFGALILDKLQLGVDYAELRKIIYLMVFLTSGFLIVGNLLEVFYNEHRFLIFNNYRNSLIRKQMDMDFIQLESLKLKRNLQAIDESFNANGGLETVVSFSYRLFNSLLSFGYSIILIRGLFIYNPTVDKGPVLNILFNYPVLSIILILVFIGTSIWSYQIYQKMQIISYQFMEENMDGNRVFSYLYNLSCDYHYGKTFRIYGGDELCLKRMLNYQKKFSDNYEGFVKKTAGYSILISLGGSLMMLCSYLYVGSKALLGYISIGAIVSSVSALTSLFSSINETLNMINSVEISKKYFVKLDEYLALPSAIYHGSLPIEKRDDNLYLIEFKHVSFTYPNTEKEILHDINFTLPIGQKTALVGPNGAGKTTFIKLLLRLYDPTEGTITLNGIDIKKYDYDEYISLMSVVFQDFKLFNLSIKNNVAPNNPDSQKVIEVLEKVGFKESLKKFTKGIDTEVYQYNNEGVELSGGEAQKVAIARALYKDSPIVILDEPTAALDPISEAEIYQSFNEIIKDKTAIFISHRMSSCVFCDEIIVFDNGQLIERGTHQELLKKKGLYSSMWEAQAKYYQ